MTFTKAEVLKRYQGRVVPAFAFLLHDTGCPLPRAVQSLRGPGQATVDLLEATQAFYTVFGGTQSFGFAIQMMDVSVSAKVGSRHKFERHSLVGDPETAGSLSQILSKLVGIGFLFQHADATWFADMRNLWNSPLQLRSHQLEFTKDRLTEDGPDYLFARFDQPGNMARSTASDRLVAVELKGRKQPQDFASAEFAQFRAQATNIHAATTDGQILAINCWTLVFNYACEDIGKPEHSTILLDDPVNLRPWDGRRRLEEIPLDFVIREHLARQCRQLGFGHLASHVLRGEWPDGVLFPPLYEVAHQLLARRRYAGVWVHFAADGTLRDVSWLRDVSCLGPWASPGRLPYRIYLLAQDANMLQVAMATSVTEVLGGAEFLERLEIHEGADEEPNNFIRLLANGSILVAHELVRPSQAVWSRV